MGDTGNKLIYNSWKSLSGTAKDCLLQCWTMRGHGHMSIKELVPWKVLE